jgi:hypothetical protein
MENLSIPQELLDEAGDILSGGFNLKVPKEAEARRTKGFARFTEKVVVEDAYRETVEKNGNTQTVFALKTKVLPREGGINTGRMFNVWNRINYLALADADPDNVNGQKKMSMGAIRRLKSLVIATGISLENGLNGDLLATLFPAKDSFEVDGGDVVKSPLVEKKYLVSINDNANSTYNGENNQEANSFALDEEDDG